MIRFAAITSLILLTASVGNFGCGTVRPAADYLHARSLLAAKTGSEAAYDPEDEAAAAQRVEQLLRDGLTVDEAVQIALLNNRAFQAHFQEIGVSKADLVQSTLLTNPSLSLSVRFPEGGGRSNLGFGLAQEIADLWQIPVRKRLAQEQLEQTILKVVDAGIDLTSRSRQAYYQLLGLQLSEQVVRENADLLEHLQQVAQRRFSAGEATILDVNLLQSNALDAKMNLVTIHRDLALSRAAFDRLLGISTDTAGVTLTEVLPTASPNLVDDEELLAQAMEARLDLKIAAADLDTAELEIRRQHRAFLPNVTVGIDAERPEARAPSSPAPLPPALGNTDLSGLSASQTINQNLRTLSRAWQAEAGQNTRDLLLQQMDEARGRQEEKSQAIDLLLGGSLQLTLPLWDQNTAQISKAGYQYLQKQKNYEELLLAVVQEVRQAAATARSAQSLLGLSTSEALPLAERNVATAERVYQAGEDSILVLLLAQQTLNAQHEACIARAADFAIAQSELERVLGGKRERGAVPPANPEAAVPAE